MSQKNRADRARAAAEHRNPSSRATSRTLLPIVAVAVVAVIAVVVAVLVSGDDGDSDVDTATESTGAGDLLATADVTVRGEPLPELPAGQDPAVGMSAPALEGVAPDGTPTTVAYDGDEPTLLAFLAHWCPHCQAELPNLVDLADDGALDGVRPVIVLTGTNENAPNHPPAPWLEEEGWDGEVLVDDTTTPAGRAFGLSGYPYLVLVGADGNVVARSSGELGRQGLEAFVQQAG